MFRLSRISRKLPRRFPRVRGDVPGHSVKGFQASRVFPACAGMFLDPTNLGVESFRFPRVRGDVPHTGDHAGITTEFSPRARGCSCRMVEYWTRPWVFPACAGMFLDLAAVWSSFLGFPRVRGDVPRSSGNPSFAGRFSPRARGCSDRKEPSCLSKSVFPACAGMFRRPAAVRASIAGFPRVRGDVPPVPGVEKCPHQFSPRARGCSVLHERFHDD